MKLPAKIISQEGKNLHVVWEEDLMIKPGDEIIDIEAFRNGYDDSVRICESIEDAIYCTNSGGYRKLICGPEKIGYFMAPGTVNHDRAIMYLDDFTVEQLHPDTLLEILSSGGECEIQIHNLDPEWYEFDEEPVPFLIDNKILIHKKENQKK
jgi:hypothetical protein